MNARLATAFKMRIIRSQRRDRLDRELVDVEAAAVKPLRADLTSVTLARVAERIGDALCVGQRRIGPLSAAKPCGRRRCASSHVLRGSTGGGLSVSTTRAHASLTRTPPAPPIVRVVAGIETP